MLRDTAAGPWLIDSDDPDTTTPAQIEHALAHNRYWWLPGADMDDIRASLAELFDTHDIETVVPDNGPLLRGAAALQKAAAGAAGDAERRALVEQERELTLEALRALPAAWPEAGLLPAGGAEAWWGSV